ncbi:MAG: glycosyltransferase family 2 protein [Elusimicrobiota bacterium]|jgi:undecaprenyl-phosphate 4-deoxy-4-formamido-L-arabinose transferase|nr:glycosyltransferase family 2 protein [Elusimicrobiota bacterium]
MKKLSIIIPCYRSQDTLPIVVRDCISKMDKIAGRDYEIILVNDCSPDGVLKVMQDLCAQYPNIKGIDLAKNFGQHAAIMAGLSIVSGALCIFLDDDGQTPIDEVDKLLAALDDDTDAVYAKYPHIKQSLFRIFGSKINDIMAQILIDKPKGIRLTSYFVCKRFLADEILHYHNAYPYLGGLVFRSTKKIKNIEISHKERISGDSGYTIKKLLSLWLNGFTAFSVKPLRIATFAGFCFSILGFIMTAYTVISKILKSDMLLGYSSTMAVLLFIGGMLMLMLGIIGEYIGRIYISINNAPQYVIRKIINKN